MTLKLNIGVGKQRYNGYLGLDIWPGPAVDLIYNMKDPLPFPNESVSEILCNSTLEHVPQWEVPRILREWHRVLEREGVAWGRVPDTDAYVKAYVEALDTGDRYMEARALDALLGETRSNQYLHRYQAHQSAFSVRTLLEAFNDGGFGYFAVEQVKESKWDFVLIFLAGKVAAPALNHTQISVPWRKE